jgi:hypothetical protein
MNNTETRDRAQKTMHKAQTHAHANYCHYPRELELSAKPIGDGGGKPNSAQSKPICVGGKSYGRIDKKFSP